MSSRFERVRKAGPDQHSLHVNVPIGLKDQWEKDLKRKLKPIDTKGGYPTRGQK